MSEELFPILLDLVGLEIWKQDTNYRKSIRAEEGLSICLRGTPGFQAWIQKFHIRAMLFWPLPQTLKVYSCGKWHGNYGVPVPKLGTYLLIRINKREPN
ncbi:hypothetical protein TNCV_110961 [Trichonephila clavipes]|nr:hypothetical protein TNCV_110961 [Trichonephila clavipes]